jgi:hypothetical protein
MVMPDKVMTQVDVVELLNVQKAPAVMLPPFVMVSVAELRVYSVETEAIVIVTLVVNVVSTFGSLIGPVGPVGPNRPPCSPHPGAP